ncbi:MAG: hypothetical protein AB7P03_26455 [Kofleriaceae bacterium]
MTVSRFRVARTETRDLADRERVGTFSNRFAEPVEWTMSNRSFFSAFVVIAAVLAVVALAAR